MQDIAMRMKKIKRVSFLLKWAAIGMVFLCPLMDAIWWILGGFPEIHGFTISMIPIKGLEIPPIAMLSPRVRAYGFLTTLIPIGFTSWICYWLSALFHSFEKLEIFTYRSVRFIRYIGWALLIEQLIFPLYTGLISLVLTFSNPPGRRMITLSMGLPQLSLLTIALVILLISWILDEGRRLKEESEGIV